MSRPFSVRTFGACTLASLVMTLLPAQGVAAAFRDVGTSTSYATAINALQAKGVLQGYADGRLQPGAAINRAELLKIILESDKTFQTDPLSDQCFEAGYAKPIFSDVDNTAWYAKYVCAAKSLGIVSGYPDGTFKPEQPVTFVEASKIFSLAYKQTPQEGGNQWYEPYVRALDSSKAIPTSINGLEKKLTRGEMAEMMWRLSEGKTDQPSKGYLNVKYPSLAVNLSSDAPQTAKSCADLQAFTEEAQGQDGGYRTDNGMMFNRAEGAMGALAPTTAGMEQKAALPSQTSADGSYSQTNVQVQGVDEGDIVKTDGTYLYIVSQNKIRIVQVQPSSAIKEVATLNDASTSTTFHPTEVYVDGDRLVVLGSRFGAYGGGPVPMYKMIPGFMPINQNRTEVRIYDISNRSKPILARSLGFDGSNVSSRKIDQKLYLVLNQPVSWAYLQQGLPSAQGVLPHYDDSALGTGDHPVTDCAKVTILPRIPSPQYLTVAVIPTVDAKAEVKRTVILGNAENVYASTENLYVAATHWNYEWDSSKPGQQTETTNVYRFALGKDGAVLQAQGAVPGHVLNQFSMDENGSTFRIATTSGNDWMENAHASNNLYILNMDLNVAGSLENIAPDEQIYAVRFIGNRAYMVTFQSIDPLFVIDTSDPRHPKILGELKIPGYSNYLHPYDETHLIGFGKDVDASIDADKVHSSGAVYYTAVQGLKVALFDVSDVAQPRELFKTVIGDRGSDSPLLTDHKALLFEKDKNLLAFPVTVTQLSAADKATPDQSSVWPSTVFQGAYVYDLSLTDGFRLRGQITHHTAAETQSMYGDSSDIQRIVRVSDSLLTVSDATVQSNALKSLLKEGSISFPVDAVEAPMMQGGIR